MINPTCPDECASFFVYRAQSERLRRVFFVQGDCGPVEKRRQTWIDPCTIVGHLCDVLVEIVFTPPLPPPLLYRRRREKRRRLRERETMERRQRMRIAYIYTHIYTHKKSLEIREREREPCAIDRYLGSLSLSATQFAVSGWRKGEGRKADENVKEEEEEGHFLIELDRFDVSRNTRLVCVCFYIINT